MYEVQCKDTRCYDSDYEACVSSTKINQIARYETLEEAQEELARQKRWTSHTKQFKYRIVEY